MSVEELVKRARGIILYTSAGEESDLPETLADKLEELAAENERLKEDRARFPDRPDDIGRMIEAHIGNLKAGKKSAEALADKAFDRAFRAEAALAEKNKEIADLTKKFETLKRAYDRERRKPIQILGSNAGGKDV